MQTPAAPASRAGSKTHTLPRTSLSRINGLAAQFVSEPEMILAYLEPLPPDSPQLPVICAAADKAVQARPDYADLQYFAAYAAFRAGNLPRARELVDCATRLNPQYKAALILAGRICLQQNEHAAALTNLQQALAAGADYPDVYVLLGDAWQARGDLVRAAKAYRQALCKNHRLTEARRKLGAISAGRNGGPV